MLKLTQLEFSEGLSNSRFNQGRDISMRRGKKADVTQLHLSVRNGEESMDKLFEEVYSDLKEIASIRLENQRSGHTLNTTGLVHEAYLKMIKYQDVD
jgi:hypothetical protein